MTILIRWLIAFALIALTFNPTDYNYIRWAVRDWNTQTPLILLAGLILTVGYVIYFRATIRSIGPFGMALVLALVGALAWVLVDWGILHLDNRGGTIWLGIFALSVVLGVGLSWSIIRKQLSGQVDTDDVEE